VTIVHILGSASLGGGELCALNLAAGLQARGRRTAVWVPSSGAAFNEAMELGLNAEIVRYGDAAKRLGPRVLKAHWNLKLALMRKKPSILHVHSALTYGALSRSLEPSATRKTVSHVQIDGPKERFQWCYKRPPSLIVPCADYLLRKVNDATCACTRIKAVYNSVDTKRFCDADRIKARQRLGMPAEKPVMLMLANLAPHKGQETAIRCTGWLAERGVAVECWLAGMQRDGNDYETHLRTLCAKLGLVDSVRFLGQRRDPEVLLQACDFVLLPSSQEGLPFTIVEAQASKRVVLATPTAGIPEVIEHEETGFLFGTDDVVGYGSAIENLIANPAYYSHITGQAFRQIQDRYTWDVYVERIMDLYDSLYESTS